MRCDWCMEISEPYATVKGKHICSAQCLMYYAAYLMGRPAKETAQNIVNAIEEMERRDEARSDDDLPF